MKKKLLRRPYFYALVNMGDDGTCETTYDHKHAFASKEAAIAAAETKLAVSETANEFQVFEEFYQRVGKRWDRQWLIVGQGPQ